jgi:hypothetical protein
MPQTVLLSFIIAGVVLHVMCCTSHCTSVWYFDEWMLRRCHVPGRSCHCLPYVDTLASRNQSNHQCGYIPQSISGRYLAQQPHTTVWHGTVLAPQADHPRYKTYDPPLPPPHTQLTTRKLSRLLPARSPLAARPTTHSCCACSWSPGESWWPTQFHCQHPQRSQPH